MHSLGLFGYYMRQVPYYHAGSSYKYQNKRGGTKPNKINSTNFRFQKKRKKDGEKDDYIIKNQHKKERRRNKKSIDK